LRCICVALSIECGAPKRQIQEWPGNIDFLTTASISKYLAYRAKAVSADAMPNGSGAENQVINVKREAGLPASQTGGGGGIRTHEPVRTNAFRGL
jgi:hypothetical protein